MMTLITGFTCPPTIYFKFITKCDKCYYKVRQLFYYKVRQVLLQSATAITKCDNFITKCDRYYEVRRLLQSATVHTCRTLYLLSFFLSFSIQPQLQWRIRNFFKKGVVSMRAQGKRPRAKGMGEVGWGEGLELAGYVWICRFFHLDFRGIGGTIHISSTSTVAWWSLRDQRIAFQQVSSDIVDLEQVLIRFIEENDRSASALVIDRVLGKASSSKSPIASKRSFGSSLSVDCQTVFHLRTSFPRDLGNEMFFSHYDFYFIIQR